MASAGGGEGDLGPPLVAEEGLPSDEELLALGPQASRTTPVWISLIASAKVRRVASAEREFDLSVSCSALHASALHSRLYYLSRRPRSTLTTRPSCRRTSRKRLSRVSVSACVAPAHAVSRAACVRPALLLQQRVAREFAFPRPRTLVCWWNVRTSSSTPSHPFPLQPTVRRRGMMLP